MVAFAFHHIAFADQHLRHDCLSVLAGLVIRIFLLYVLFGQASAPNIHASFAVLCRCLLDTRSLLFLHDESLQGRTG